MSHRATAFAVVAAALLAAAVVGGGVAGGASASATDARPTALAAGEDAVADLTDTLQRVDEFLETVLDLVRTLNRLFGAGD